MNFENYKKTYFFLFFFLASTALLLFHLVPHAAHFDVDSANYQEIACHFVQHNQLLEPSRPTVLPSHTLGYPFVLAIAYKLFGCSAAVAVGLNVLLSLIALLFIMLAAFHVGGTVAATSAGILCVLSGGLSIYAQFVLADVLLLALLAAFFERMCAFMMHQKKSALVTALFMLGCSMLVRPAAYYFVFPLVFFIGMFFGRVWKKGLGFRLSCIAACYLPVFLYSIYNYYMFGYFGLTSLGKENILFYFMPRLLSLVEGVTLEQGLQQMRSLGDQAASFTWQYINLHTFAAVKLWMINVSKAFFGLYATQLKLLFNPAIKGGMHSFFQMEGGLLTQAVRYVVGGTDILSVKIFACFEFCMLAVRYVLALWGSFFLVQERRFELLIFSFLYLAYFALITGHDGCARYRMMLEPVLIVLSALGICGITCWIRRRSKK